MRSNHLWHALTGASAVLRQAMQADYERSARLRAQEMEALMRQARPSGLLGDGGLADLRDAQAANLFDPEGIFLGALNGRMLFYNGEGPVVVWARTRAGKGRDIILPNLAHLRNRSVVVTDGKKGENAFASADHRANRIGTPCIFLNPFGVQGFPNTRINPLQGLIDVVKRGDRIDTEAREAAQTLLPASPKTKGEDWARRGAQRFLAMFWEYAALFDQERCSLSGAWRFCNSDQRQLEVALALISTCGVEALERKAGAFERLIATAPKQFEAYRGDAAEALDSYEPGSALDDATSRHEFDFAELKRRPHSVFLILPSDKLGVAASWISLVLNHAIETIARARGPVSTTFLLDEFSQLPPSPSIMKSLRLYSGLGIQLVFFAQGRFSMEDRWSAEAVKEIEDQAAVMVLKGVLQPELMKDLELWSGNRTVLQRGVAHNGGAVESANANLGETRRAVLQSEDIMRLTDKLILRVAGMPRLLVADAVPFYDVTPWKDQIRDVRKLHRGEAQ